MSQPRIIISGGGTGGHIFPAIAIANEVKLRHPDAAILFVGAQGRMEMEKVPAAGFEIIGLPITGIQRKLTLSNLLVPFRLIKSIFQAKKIIRTFKPDVVVGVGGYASAAVLYAASAAKIPTLIQEQNSYAGLTNKWLGKKVTTICVAYEGMERFFPKNKIVITGNPVRKEIADAMQLSQTEAKQSLGFSTAKPLVLSIGGSLGARTINTSLQKNLNKFQQSDVQLLWQTGQYFKPDTETFTNIKATAFINNMSVAYAAADVVISRAGAISISELSLLHKPCILVPSPNVSEDHQTMNAMALTSKNAAVLIKDTAAETTLVDSTLELILSSEQKTKLSENIRQFAKPNALVNIVDQINQLTKWI
ncbi:MAG: undecaprenyldiphospho-muramoylpentapeptide beta-N-acetylglucosaminyltransferase [Bacteroidota bacterium]